MNTHARTPLVPKTRGADKTAMTTAPVAAVTPAVEAHVQPRQLEKSVSLTGTERLRYRWYRLRLTVAEMNYATRHLAELQARLP
jgi:hypothetical protein